MSDQPKKSGRSFHKYIFTFEVISEEELPADIGLKELDYEITEGHCVGRFVGDCEYELIDGSTCAKHLLECRSDPEFFRLTPEGEDIEEEFDEPDEQI